MKKTFLFLLLSLSLFSATARVYNVRANLNGANVVPANTTIATGTLTGTFDDVTGVLNYTLSHNNVPVNIENGYTYYLHLGVAGTNGIYVNEIYEDSNPYSASFTFLNIAEVIAGNTYSQIIGGNGVKIRGQIIIGMEIFNNAARNAFYGIGGYSHTDGYIPDFKHKSPFVWTGPSPQNDFQYVATTSNGSDLYGSLGRLSTFNANTPITLSFVGNNVRKIGLNVYEEDIASNFTSGNIIATVTTNLNNTATLTSTNGARFVGFRVLNQDEYIVSATFSANSGFYTSLDNITFGDDSPQNVALHFDGVDDYVSLPSNVGDFGTTDNFTVSCWFRPDPTATGEKELIGKWDFSSGTNFAFTIRYNGDNGTTYAGQFTDPTFSTVGSSADLRDGKWHHIAFTKNASALELVIDGVSAGTGTDNAAGTTTNGLPLNIGRRGGSGSNYFKGEIDEVRIWNIGKNATQIADERFCKTPDPSGLQYFYNFNNGVPHDNNTQITQIQNLTTGGSNHGTLHNFTRTGDASNFVTGQVKYVKSQLFLSGNNSGSSWTNAFNDLQLALPATTCNDLFDVYVAKGVASYKPDASNINISFNIPTGMRVYGGFAGTEKSINQRNLALIQSTNETTLSGDLSGNDTPFNFNTNRDDNSLNIVQIAGSNSLFDGFTVRGAKIQGIFTSANPQIKNSRFIDNSRGIILGFGSNATIFNSSFVGNSTYGFVMGEASLNINNSLIANNGNSGIIMTMVLGNHQIAITNCTIAANAANGIRIVADGGNLTLITKNTINYGNLFTGLVIENNSGTTNTSISNSLIQGQTSTANGNLNGNTVNPQFVSPLAAGFGGLSLSNLGDYRLKWCSLAINAGENGGISPLDLDRKPRNFNAQADMGAYEFLGNTPSQANNSTITGTIDSPTYTGGAIQTITSTAKILAPAGAIDFKAPNAIILNPGFEARGVGQYFKAEIGANVGCVNN